MSDRYLTLVAGAGLAVVLLFSLAPIPRSGSASTMPWKVELAAAIFLLAALAVMRWTRPLSSVLTRVVLLLTGAFVLFSALSIMWAGSRAWAIHHTLVWGCYVGFLYLFLNTGKRMVLAAFAITSIGLASMMLVDLTTSPDFTMHTGGEFRIRYGRPAELLATISPVLLAWALSQRKRFQVVLISTIWLAGWIGVMLSLSRGAFLAGLAAHVVAFVGLFMCRMRRRTTVLLAGVWLLVTCATQFGISAATSIPSTADYTTRADKSQMTVSFRVFAWSVGLEMAKANWFVGVGAGNFGVAVNETRRSTARTRTGSGIEPAEDFVIERVHNEPLQVLDELGIVGLGILLALAALIVYACFTTVLRRRFQMRPLFWGALAGSVAFVASSMVSSFSFRAIQNGIAFMAVVAILLIEINRRSLTKKTPPEPIPAGWRYVGIGFAVCMLIFAGSKTLAEQLMIKAERSDNANEARELFESSLSIDPDNPRAWAAYASGIAKTDPGAGAEHLRTAIRLGLGATLTYSALADYYLQADDLEGAKAAFTEGLAIFPNSVFLRVRFVRTLEQRGETIEAAKHMAIAEAVDLRQAKGWHAILSRGSVAAFYLAKEDESVAAPADLLPQTAVLQYLDKRGGV